MRRTHFRSNRTQAFWLTLLLLLAVLVPSICLLWFMNQAVHSERLAVRQRLTEAYRGYLSLARERLESSWEKTEAERDAQLSELFPRALFARQVRDGIADAVLVFDGSGNLLYPDRLQALEPLDSSPDWTAAKQLESSDPVVAAQSFANIAALATNANTAALALQAQARCLLQAGKKAAALNVLTGPLSEPRFQTAKDSQGRLLALNAQLLALELIEDTSSPDAQELREQLQSELLDYEADNIPAPQRRFLLRGLNKLYPEESLSTMLSAEELASRFTEAEPSLSFDPGLRASPLPGVWQFTSERGRLIALHMEEHLRERMRKTLATQELPADVRVDFVPPGQEPENALLSRPIGAAFPGWRVAVSMLDPHSFDVASRQRITLYVWTGVLVVALVLALGVLAMGVVRRQSALTQLRNDLVANVTHELKTPLSSMRLLVDTLLDAPRLNEQTTREYLDLIARENLRLSRLIDNFLMFSRIERNKYAFAFRDVPAASIVEGAAAAVSKRFDEPGCQFEVRTETELPEVKADADAMVTALVNLLDNAWKYSGDTKRITLSAEARNGVVNFKVADNGIGLTAQDSKKVFERFYRVGRHLSQPSSGCGLGLSIVQFIVQAHEGTISVDSKPEQGSTFTITLPAGNNRQT